MSRRRGVMSESFKNELAKDLGFYDVVQREGWEGIRTKDAGNMVKRAIQIAEEQLAKQYSSSGPSMQASYSPQNAMQNSYSQAPLYNQQAVQAPQGYGQQAAVVKPAYTPSYGQMASPGGSAHAGWNPVASASQQAVQAEQRPYYS